MGDEYVCLHQGLPCHLYFDLEFNKRDNAEKNGDEMVDLLISVVFDALSDKYSIEGDRDWIVELDSSTDGGGACWVGRSLCVRKRREKFSRHLIIRLQKTAFKDNSHAGAFVAEICSRIYKAKESDESLGKLLVSKDSGSAGIPCQLFVDTAVYSRNRCFRLPLSSKAGKNSVLLPTGRFKCKNMSEEDVFMASLICNMDVDCEKLLICKMDLDCVKTLQFDTEKSLFSKTDQVVGLSRAHGMGHFDEHSTLPSRLQVTSTLVILSGSHGNAPVPHNRRYPIKSGKCLAEHANHEWRGNRSSKGSFEANGVLVLQAVPGKASFLIAFLTC
ncbi:hypothetical protein U1Q18_004640 [Sarracenia purpurea var. burkii]